MRLIIFCLLLWLPLYSAVAHEQGITDTAITIAQDRLSVMFTVPEELISTLDGGDASVANAAVRSVVAQGFTFTNAGTTCDSYVSASRRLSAIGSIQMVLSVNCHEPITELKIVYSLFFDTDSRHSNIVHISLLGLTQVVTLNSDTREHDVDVKSIVEQVAAYRDSDGTTAPPAFTNSSIFPGVQFFTVGVEHILFGYDHVLFLICLVLLPMRPLQILALVTSFTIAHSLTLTLSVLDKVTLPPRPVEMAIAFSIVYVSIRTIMILRRSAASDIKSSDIKERLFASFLFGLIHGFGFSYILKEIGLGDQLISSLLFFNLGVEVGQLALLIFLIPLVFWLTRRLTNMKWAQLVSAATASMGTFWLLERVVSA